MSEGYFIKPLKILLMVIGALTCIAGLGYWGIDSIFSAMLGEAESIIVQTKTSPNGLIVATLRRSSGGATTTYVYRVSVQPQDAKEVEKLVAVHLDNIQLEWQSDELLSIVMPCGEVSEYSNFERVRDNGSYRTVEVRLTTNGLCR